MKTIEQIKGMNIPLGAPIELTLNYPISSGLRRRASGRTHKALGYFQRIKESNHSPTYGEVICTPILGAGNIENTFEKPGYEIYTIEDIKVLEYRK